MGLRQQLAITNGLPQEKTIGYAVYPTIFVEILVEARDWSHEDNGVAVFEVWVPDSPLRCGIVSEQPGRGREQTDRCTSTTDVKHVPVAAYFATCVENMHETDQFDVEMEYVEKQGQSEMTSTKRQVF